MPLDGSNPKFEGTTEIAIRESREVLRAIVLGARRGSARHKGSILVALDLWPSQLHQPLDDEIAQQFPKGRRRTSASNESVALECFLSDFLTACHVTPLGRFAQHASELMNGSIRKKLIREIVHALELTESQPTGGLRSEIPGIDLRQAAALIRLGSAKKIPALRIAHWIQQELPIDAIFTEIKLGGLPPGYSLDRSEHRFGGHGAQIAELFRFDLDRDPEDLDRIATRLETSPFARGGFEELFWLFGKTRDLPSWIAQLMRHADETLEMLADLAIMDPIEYELSSGRRTAEEGAATRTQEPTGGPSDSPNPPNAGSPVADAAVAGSGASELTAKWNWADWERARKAALLYEELQRMQTVAAGNPTEEELKTLYPKEFTIWKEIESLPKETRADFFPRIRSQSAEDLYAFVGKFFGLGAVRTKKIVTAWRTRRADFHHACTMPKPLDDPHRDPHKTPE